MAKKKNLEEQLANAETVAQSPVASYLTTEEETRSRRRMISFYVAPELYQKIQSLADYRAALGQKNQKGQPFSAAALMNEALEEYIERNRDTLHRWEEFSRQLAANTEAVEN